MEQLELFFNSYDLVSYYCEDANTADDGCISCDLKNPKCKDAEIRRIRPQITDDRVALLIDLYLQEVGDLIITSRLIPTVVEAFNKVSSNKKIVKSVQEIFGR